MDMKRFLLYSLFLVVTASLVISCSEVTDRDMQNLKGKVKLISVRSHWAVKESGEWVPGSISEYENFDTYYTEDGKYTESQSYDNNHKFHSKIAPTKQERGKVVEETVYDKRGKVISIIKIAHLSDKKMSFEIYNTNNILERKGETNKNSSNKILYAYAVDSYDDRYETKHDYDNNGELIKTTNSSPNDTITYSFKYPDVDEKGNWTKKIVFLEEGDPYHIVTRKIEYY